MSFSPRRRSHIISAIAEKGAYKGRIKKHSYELVKFIEYGPDWAIANAIPIGSQIYWTVCINRQWKSGFKSTVWKALEAVEEAVGF